MRISKKVDNDLAHISLKNLTTKHKLSEQKISLLTRVSIF